MFSYLNNKRPHNRKSAVATTTPPPPIGVVRHYHETSRSARDGYGPPLYHDANSPSVSSPSPISADPPILPPMSFGASPHDSPSLVETGAGSLTLAMKQVEGQLSETSRDGAAATTAKNKVCEGEGDHPTQPLSLVSGSPGPVEDWKFRLEDTSRPQSKEGLINIPQPNRPPPLPPVSHAKPEKPGPGGVIQARHGKTKLNLLNPMSILARRKYSQSAPQPVADKHSQSKGSHRHAIGPLDDYDPRIRGNLIHDFSAPRTGRTYSSNDVNKSTRDCVGKNQPQLSPDPHSFSPPGDDSPIASERRHTPVFKEHFDDEIGRENGSTIERERQKASGFMYQVSLTESYLEPVPDPSSLPPFARNLAAKLSKATEAVDQPSAPHSSLEVVRETSLLSETSPSQPSKPSSPVSPPKVRSRASSNADSSFQPGGLPKRFKSNASRFSFDLAGVGSSAQEKILEERHRQKAKSKARASHAPSASQVDDHWDGEESGETYSDYNSIYDDDGLEESIPGVNTDADVDSLALSRQTVSELQPLYPSKSLMSDCAGSESSGVACTDTSKGSPDQPMYSSTSESFQNPSEISSPDAPSNSNHVFLAGHEPGLGIAVSPNDHSHPAPPGKNQEHSVVAPLAGIPRQYVYQDDDDLYFDDGMIDDVDIIGTEAFDESVFDDDTSRIYGLPLRDLKHLKPSQMDDSTSKLPSDRPHSVINDKSITSDTDASGLEAPEILPPAESNGSFVDSHSTTEHPISQASGLTQENLAAYHDALAFAANQAAMNGEFSRSVSVAGQRLAEPSRELPKGFPADCNGKQEVSGLPAKFDFQDPDDFDYDDALSDDPIIAAANAEALENDDEGIYGQEFGFFARATGPGEYVNGGYFGPQGVAGIGRSHSGRVTFQEPSLTPITERSEWSNRNSAISLALHGYSQSAQQAMSSPGLAQLADMMSLEEDDLSLSALMKLRRGAWGGSTTSLPSSPGNGSPHNLLPPVLPTSATNATNGSLSPNFRSSTHSLDSGNGFNSSDSDASAASPTITVPTRTDPPPAGPSPSESTITPSLGLHNPSEPDVPSIRPWSSHLAGQTSGHSRKSSGAETVSYTHESDDEGGGGGRWVVEKRRVSEGGKVEWLEREVVEGGRI